MRERYHPTDSIPLKKEVAQRRQGLLNILKENLESGLYDTICYDEPANIVSKPGILQDEKTEDSDCKDSAQSGGGQQDNLTQAQDKNGISENQQKETTISQEGLNRHISYDLSLFKASDPSTNALFIRAVPPSIKRAAIVDMCSQIQGFKYLCLSDPKPEKDMHRLGWIIFDKNTDMEAAYRAFDGQTLDNFTFHVQSHRDMDQRVRLINPDSNTKERLEKDLGQIMELTKVLEEEADIPENSGTSMIEERVSKILGHPAGNQEETQAAEHQNEEDNSASIKRTKLLLDIHITYLRCVHQYDYYSSIECMSPEDFCRKSFIYFRRSSTDKFFKKAWAEQLDFKIRLRITKPYTGPEILKIGGKTLDIDLDKSLSKHVKKEGEGKRRCRQCGKLFKAEQFVRKHIKLKHSGIANAIEEEIKYFDNFVRDQQRADSFRYYLNAGGSIVNLGMRNQSQMGQNLLMSGVVPQLPGILSMMPNQIPGMNKNINIAALNMLMMNLSRIRQQTSAMGGMYPGVIPRQQQAPLLSDRNPQYPPGGSCVYESCKLTRPFLILIFS